LKLGLAAAIVVVAVLIGVNVLGTSAVGGPGINTASPTPEPTATPAPTPTPIPQGLLPEGPHALAWGNLPMTVTIPAGDWFGERGGGILLKNDSVDGPEGAGMIVFVGDLYVYGDPCEWRATRPDAPSTSVDELVAALRAQASRDATEPVDI